MTSQFTPQPKQFLTNFFRKVEFGDLLLLVYLIVIVRQWFWIIGNTPAWIGTIAVSIPLWFYYVATKTDSDSAPPISFWFIVGIPLLAAYLLRLPFPDAAFDVWNLRLFHAERGLRGFIYWPGEFFPTTAPFNPTPDMITGLSRWLFGYRLGTVVNFFALLWAAMIVEKILRRFVTRGLLRSFVVALIVIAEHLLFEINNYMPDLLALPLLLEATRITLNPNDSALVTRRVVRVAFLIGMAIALKLSNASIALPLVLIWMWRLGQFAIQHRERSERKRLVLAALAAIAVVPLQILPFSIWCYKITGSPVFPLYNGIFRSPLYPAINGWDDRWGGFGVFEIVFWPIIMFLKPVRTAEIHFYSGRLTVAFFLALLCLVLARRLNAETRFIAFILALSTLLWSMTMGYIRYGMYLEVLSGLLMVLVAASLLKNLSVKSVPSVAKGALGVLFVLTLVAQSVLASYYVLHYEWSLRPTVFSEPERYKLQMRHVLTDRAIKPLLGKREIELFSGVDVWIVSGIKTVGLIPFLTPDAMVMGTRSAGLFLAPANRTLFETSIKNVEGKRLASLAIDPDFPEAVFALRSVGLRVGAVEPAVIPFFSEDDRLGIYFFEVQPDISRPEPARTPLENPLPEDAYRASITKSFLRIEAPGGTNTNFFHVRNDSATTWPSLPGPGGTSQLVLRARWLSSEGTEIGKPTEMTLPFDLSPGETTTIPLPITAPSRSGDFTLEIDMIQRDGATFKSKGSTPFSVKHSI